MWYVKLEFLAHLGQGVGFNSVVLEMVRKAAKRSPIQVLYHSSKYTLPIPLPSCAPPPPVHVSRKPCWITGPGVRLSKGPGNLACPASYFMITMFATEITILLFIELKSGNSKGRTIRKVMGGGGVGNFQLVRFFFSLTAFAEIFFSGEPLCTNFFYYVWKSHNWTFLLHEFFFLPSSLHEFFFWHFALHEFFFVFFPTPLLPPPSLF